MYKLIANCIISLFIASLTGCTPEVSELVQSGSITFETQSDTTVLATRKFNGLEEVEFSIESDESKLVGFRTELSQAEREQLMRKAELSGDFESNFSGTVSQLPSGNGIGAMDGAVIEMTPKDGTIKFKFQNLLENPKSFEIYTMNVPAVEESKDPIRDK